MNKTVSVVGLLKQSFLLYAMSVLFLAFAFFTYIFGSTVLSMMNFEGWIFFIASCISHASQIMLVPFLVCLPLVFMRWQKVALAVHAVLIALILILNYINEQVFAIYKFHINGFIISMVTGPSASDIFTFDTMLYVKEIMLFLIFVAVAIGLLFASKWIYEKKHKVYSIVIIPFFIGCTLFAHVWHVYAYFYQHVSVVKSAQLLPYYFPTTANSLLEEKFGLLPPNNLGHMESGEGNGDVNYPLHSLVTEKPDTLPNIIVVMIDSWSRRAMTEQCMPNTYRFAQSNSWYKEHVSCSNGTRTSVFGFYFALPGYYWESFESAEIRPAFIDLLLKYGYDIQTFASADMKDPPFRRVVFGNVKGLDPNSHGKTTYERDNYVATEIMKKLGAHKNGEKPFFYYLFFDMPHSFDGLPDSELQAFQPSWKYADYSKLDNDMDPTPYWNLYCNCCHFDDKLIGRIFQQLEQKKLLDNTIVIVTGDHAQEFNENKKNYWGHNGNFSKWQIGVPMIIHYPGKSSRQFTHRTTHYDVIPTLMHDYLGVKNPISDYTIGTLMNDTRSRDWHIVGSKLNYAFVIHGDTILEKTAEGSLDVWDSKMNLVPDYVMDVRCFNKATDRLNHFFRK